MHKLRVIPWLLGLVVILFTLAGANRLLHPTETPTGGAAVPVAVKPPIPTGNDSLVAKGTIHSDPPTVAYTLPAHLQAATVFDVKVQAGDKVNVDDVLVVFDTALMQKDLEKARMSYNTAVQEYNKAVTAQQNNEIVLKTGATLAVKDAQEDLKAAQDAFDLAKRSLEKQLETLKNADGSPLTSQQIDERRRDDIPLMQTQSKLNKAANFLKEKELAQKAVELDANRLKIMVEQAAFQANAIKEELEKVERAIKDSTLRAKAAGVVEQVTAAKGQTVYPQTQPLMYLVPTGKRVVWAEIVPDFSHRIKDRDGQKVTITDDSNTQLTYEGVVHRTRSAFLPKPNGGPDLLNGKPNVVLIVEVEVVDPSPAGKPPLRVGQPVRVIFP